MHALATYTVGSKNIKTSIDKTLKLFALNVPDQIILTLIHTRIQKVKPKNDYHQRFTLKDITLIHFVTAIVLFSRFLSYSLLRMVSIIYYLSFCNVLIH